MNRGIEGFIGIGFQTEEVIQARLPGWEPHSYGYHGDDGCAFSGSGRGRPYGPTYSSGDVIGALFNRPERTISFYKNGLCLGVAFDQVAEERLYPCIGLRTNGEEVLSNLGGQPYLADFEAMQAGLRDQVVSAASAMPLPMLSSKGTPLLPQLLYDHLLHHRCWQTAAVISRDLLRPAQDASTSSSQDSTAADVAARQKIYELVVAGQVEEAVEQVVKHYTRAPLDANPTLDFRLKVAQFCELLRPGGAAAVEAALTYGRLVLAPHSPKGSDDEELLSDALSLLAYERPAESPCGHLLSQAARASLAESLNSAILAARGMPAVSPLERIYQQACVAIQELRTANDTRAALLDVRKLCLQQPAAGAPAAAVAPAAAAPGQTNK